MLEYKLGANRKRVAMGTAADEIAAATAHTPLAGAAAGGVAREASHQLDDVLLL